MLQLVDQESDVRGPGPSREPVPSYAGPNHRDEYPGDCVSRLPARRLVGSRKRYERLASNGKSDTQLWLNRREQEPKSFRHSAGSYLTSHAYPDPALTPAAF